LIIFDCAHNKDSYKALETTLKDLGIKNFRLVFGTNEHKDFRHCMKHIASLAREVILVRADHPRAIPPELLAQQVQTYNSNIIIAGTMKNALAYVRGRPVAAQATIITGSFYLWQPEWHTPCG
jgi:dihydrofolate synthase/folylpolyglutamate synthase